MSIKKSRKQRGLENLIRKIVNDEVQKVASSIAREEIEMYDYEKSKPEVWDEKDVMKLFDTSGLIPSLPQESEAELKKQAKEMYEKMGVPYGTPLYMGGDFKLHVYPEYRLPVSYKKSKSLIHQVN